MGVVYEPGEIFYRFYFSFGFCRLHFGAGKLTALFIVAIKITMQLLLTSFIPKSKLLGVCTGILISSLMAILFCMPFYFLEGKVAIIYFFAVYFCVPLIIGVVITLMLGYHKKGSVLESILYSQLSTILSFITLSMTFQPNLGYGGALIVMCFPLCMIFTAMGTMIGCEWLLINEKLDID